MSKLAKHVKKANKPAKAFHRAGPKKDKGGLGGSLGHELLRVGVNAGLSVATNAFETVGPIPIAIDTAGLVVGIGLMALGKGKTRRLGQDIVAGAANAHIGRAVYAAKKFEIIVSKDGKPADVVEIKPGQKTSAEQREERAA